MMQRHQDLSRRPESHDFIRLVLADLRKPKHLLIERDRLRQVLHLDAHMVNLRGLNSSTGCLPIRFRPARRRKHREPLDQPPPRERPLFEPFQQVRNNRFHIAS